MARPSCVVNLADLPGEKRPRLTPGPGIGAIVKSPGDATGLTHMGVHVRTIAPGFAGTNRHFHTIEEEWSYVLTGRGTVRIGPLRVAVRPGHFVSFPPGPRPHHFVADAGETLVLLEGGERRPGEDDGWYPDARKRWVAGKPTEPYVEPPPEQGDASQIVHIDDVPLAEFRHDVDRGVLRRQRTLHKPTGLERQALRSVLVPAGGRSTAMHSHERTDEWILILSGRGIARVGDDRFEVGPDDFIGHAAGGAAHVMEAVEDLSYLMGGQIDASDIVTYPEAKLRRIGGVLVVIP